MRIDSRFQEVQKRAYEISQQRDPRSASPEDDWRKAEAEVDMEGRFGSEEGKDGCPVREMLDPRTH
jgi:hypothetical protein